ncbi:MAG: arylesterase [Gammaproteobacteria bacterium]
MLFAVIANVFLAVGAQAAPKPPVLLVVGDSLSAAYKIPVAKGWVHLLSERLAYRGYAYRVVNASIPGDTTSGGLSRLPGELARYRPVIVIVELGGNDGLQGLAPVQMRSNLSQMVMLAQKAGSRVLLVGVRMPPNYGPGYTKRFEAVYKAVAKAKGVPLVPELLVGVATRPDLMQQGGIHPLGKAESKLLDNVWPALKPMLAKSPVDPAAKHSAPVAASYAPATRG